MANPNNITNLSRRTLVRATAALPAFAALLGASTVAASPPAPLKGLYRRWRAARKAEEAAWKASGAFEGANSDSFPSIDLGEGETGRYPAEIEHKLFHRAFKKQLPGKSYAEAAWESYDEARAAQKAHGFENPWDTDHLFETDLVPPLHNDVVRRHVRQHLGTSVEDQIDAKARELEALQVTYAPIRAESSRLESACDAAWRTRYELEKAITEAPVTCERDFAIKVAVLNAMYGEQANEIGGLYRPLSPLLRTICDGYRDLRGGMS